MIQLIIFAVIVFGAFAIGKMIEKKDYTELKREEESFKDILIFNERIPPNHLTGQFHLVGGSVVMSSDYFKMMLASLKSIFGGRLNSYEAMMDLGRRKAIVRMKKEAQRIGARVIFNVRIETAMLNQAQRNQGIASAEFFAYGTAFR